MFADTSVQRSSKTRCKRNPATDWCKVRGDARARWKHAANVAERALEEAKAQTDAYQKELNECQKVRETHLQRGLIPHVSASPRWNKSARILFDWSASDLCFER